MNKPRSMVRDRIGVRVMVVSVRVRVNKYGKWDERKYKLFRHITTSFVSDHRISSSKRSPLLPFRILISP